MVLEEYKDTVATIAGLTTIAQFFSPVFMCKDIVSKGSSKDVDPMPFIGGMVMSILMLQLGLILQDPAMIPVNIFGFSLNLIYFFIHYTYSTDRASLISKVTKGIALVAVLVGYANWEHADNVEFRYGIIVTLLMLCLVGAPLLQLGEIIKTKSTAGLPFPLILSGSVVTFLWLLYGIIIKNVFLQVQNLVAFTLCATQLSLFVIYPSTGKDAEKKKL